MSKKKTSYADIWIKAYLAALARLPADEAYLEANKSVALVRKFIHNEGDAPLCVKVDRHCDVDIFDDYFVPPSGVGFLSQTFASHLTRNVQQPGVDGE